jgi:hypothetical protein
MLLIAVGDYKVNRNTKISWAVVCLALAALACSAVTGGGPTDLTATPGPTVLLRDDFPSSRWGTGTDADSSVEYANNALQMIVYTKSYFVWSTPNAENYQNIHMEVTVINNNTDPSTYFGIMCNLQASTSNFYYVAIRPDGNYAIAKATEGEDDTILTNNNQWASSELIPTNAASYLIGADCANGTLTLYVDGQQIDSVFDASYITGQVAVFTSSGENATTTNVSFDDFLMTELP